MAGPAYPPRDWRAARPVPGAPLALAPGWLDAREAGALAHALHRDLPWSNHPVRLFGRTLAAPRLSCWIGDADARYRYSGTTHAPVPWPAALAAVRARLAEELSVPFNGALANLYRDGRDAMGWHRDDEPELGPSPVIASLSLGATRRFLVRADGAGTRAVPIDLPAGSLLLAWGDFQQRFRHALPRTARAVGPRINLTFRRVEGDVRPA
jgi:alkylated DNA repair dioxygenase AlkB